MKVDDLLEHYDFIFRLSKKLLSDENLAYDFCQETWLATIKKPPKKDLNPRAWLVRTLRNIILFNYRSDRNRRKRDQDAAIVKTPSTPHEIVEASEIRRHVAEAVCDLQDPYGDAIKLRYYNDLSAREIAERLNEPIETIRTRLKRGVALLKSKLDVKYGDDRKKWCVILYPITHKSVAQPLSTAGGLIGVLMNWLLKLSLLAALIIGSIYLINRDQDNNPEKSTITSNQFSSNETDKVNQETEARAVIDEAKVEKLESLTSEEETSLGNMVVWRGTVIDYTGLPIKKVSIRLNPHDETDNQDHIKIVADNEGKFEFKDLPLGEYGVELCLPISLAFKEAYLKWGKVAFKNPGIINKDIHILESEGSLVCGVLVDEKTGEPVIDVQYGTRVPGNYATIKVAKSPGFGFRAGCDPDPKTGRFVLRCLPAGTYNLHLAGPDMHSDFYTNIFTVNKGQAINDLKIKVAPLGKLEVELIGIEEELINDNFQIRIIFNNRYEAGLYNHILKDGAYHLATAGPALLILSSLEMGDLVRPIDIKPGKITKVAIHRSDLISLNKELSLSGRLKDADNNIVNHAMLRFDRVAHYQKQVESHSCILDINGEFKIEKFKYGQWRLGCFIFTPEILAKYRKYGRFDSPPKEYQFIHFHEFRLPEIAPDKHDVELIMARGEIKGELYNKLTGLPIQDLISRWMVDLLPSRNPYLNAAAVFGQDSASFHMVGISKGDYCLNISAPGYEVHMSKSFSVGDGEIVDMGRIVLTPSGILDLVVTNLAKEAIPTLNAVYMENSIDGVELEGRLISPQVIRFSCLPVCKDFLTLKITAKGYKAKHIKIQMKPDKPVEYHLTMENE